MKDEALDFLYSRPDADLNDLVRLILDQEITEGLSTTDAYIENAPFHSRYVSEIINEIQTYGGNTIANIFRGGDGVYYREIVCDVADVLKVNYNKNASVECIETYIIQKLWNDAIEKMTPEQRMKCFNDLGLKNCNLPIGEALNSAAIVAFRLGGFASYKIALIVVNSVWKFLFGKGLSLAANSAFAKALSIWAGPIGWALTAITTVIDVAGPAYRVTIPAVLTIIMLRQKAKFESNASAYQDFFKSAV